MPWTKQTRADLVKRIRGLEAREADQNLQGEAFDRVDAELSETLDTYAQGLPVGNISRCPICSQPLKVAIDPYGFDGPWWWSWCPVDIPQPQACTHFQLLLGAVDLHGREPTEAQDSVRPGPGIPFVIGRILAMSAMTAVISSFRLPIGDTIYVIAYFSGKPSLYPDLYQPWPKESFAVHNAKGDVVGWSTADDPWDFDLRKWAATGKIVWIAPGDVSLASQHSSPSPYDNLNGIHGMQIVEDGKLRVVAAPSGVGASPFE